MSTRASLQYRALGHYPREVSWHLYHETRDDTVQWRISILKWEIGGRVSDRTARWLGYGSIEKSRRYWEQREKERALRQLFNSCKRGPNGEN